MTVSIVAVGIDKWEVSSLPMIESVKRFEPNADIVLVDNAADEPYPTDAGARVVRLDKRVSMAEAMNYGAMFTKASWMLFANNDILCTAPYIKMVEGLSRKAIYGVDVLNWWKRRWLDGWIMAIPRGVWNRVGIFDPNFIYAGFEDADYCFRVEQAGYKVEGAQLPFIHKELHSRFTMPNYMSQREENIKYLCKKWDIER
mgnify:FL=1